MDGTITATFTSHENGAPTELHMEWNGQTVDWTLTPTTDRLLGLLFNAIEREVDVVAAFLAEAEAQ